jgi:DNA-binding CsgD family transcriptional regulator
LNNDNDAKTMGSFRSFWHRLINDLGLQRSSERYLELSEELNQSLQILAETEQRSREDVANDLLSLGISQRRKAEESLNHWKSLSPREQQSVSLACIGYTNAEIAKRMGISPETVKAHILRSVRKFGVRGKAELREVLADWDFSDWDT